LKANSLSTLNGTLKSRPEIRLFIPQILSMTNISIDSCRMAPGGIIIA
jgi:hypothetical protein